MAASEGSGGGSTEATCPIEGCDYTGAPQSVEGHISAETDSKHQGSVGQQYRDEIRASAGDAPGSDPTATSGTPTDSGSESTEESALPTIDVDDEGDTTTRTHEVPYAADDDELPTADALDETIEALSSGWDEIIDAGDRAWRADDRAGELEERVDDLEERVDDLDGQWSVDGSDETETDGSDGDGPALPAIPTKAVVVAGALALAWVWYRRRQRLKRRREAQESKPEGSREVPGGLMD
jgi:hypothetical protein